MKYEMPRGSFGGDKWVDFFYTWDNPDVGVNNTSQLPHRQQHHQPSGRLPGRQAARSRSTSVTTRRKISTSTSSRI